MKETVLEWLLEELNNGRHLTDELINKAEEKFEQHIIEAYNDGCIDTLKNEMKLGKQYYDKVFKNK